MKVLTRKHYPALLLTTIIFLHGCTSPSQTELKKEDQSETITLSASKLPELPGPADKSLSTPQASTPSDPILRIKSESFVHRAKTAKVSEKINNITFSDIPDDWGVKLELDSFNI